MDIVQELQEKFAAGTVIPTPDAKADFVAKGWGARRRQEALVYNIPNHDITSTPH